MNFAMAKSPFGVEVGAFPPHELSQWKMSQSQLKYVNNQEGFRRARFLLGEEECKSFTRTLGEKGANYYNLKDFTSVFT